MQFILIHFHGAAILLVPNKSDAPQFSSDMLQFAANGHDFVFLPVYTLHFQHILRIKNLKLAAPDRHTGHGLVFRCVTVQKSQFPSH